MAERDGGFIIVTGPDGEEYSFPAASFTEDQAIQEVRRIRGELGDVVVTDPDGQEHSFPADQYSPAEAIQQVRRMRGEGVNENLLQDIGSVLHGGVGTGISGIGGLVDYVGANDLGQDITQYGNDMYARAAEHFSPQLARDLDRRGIQGGDILNAIVGSVPSTVATIGGGMLAGALAPEALAGGVALGVGAGLEGLQTVGSVNNAVEQSVVDYINQDPEAFFNTRGGRQALEAAGGDREVAAQMVADRAVGAWPAIAGTLTSVIGLTGANPADLLKSQTGRQTVGRVIGNFFERQFEEGNEELWQGMQEQLAQNAAVQGVNPQQSLTEGVLEQGLLGLVGGVGGGAAFGSVETARDLGRLNQQQQPRRDARLNATRDRLNQVYNETETPAAPATPIAPAEQFIPSPPDVVANPPPGPPSGVEPPEEESIPEDTPSPLEAAMFNYENLDEEATGEQRTRAASDLINALHDHGVPEEELADVVLNQGPDALLGLAEDRLALEREPERKPSERRNTPTEQGVAGEVALPIPPNEIFRQPYAFPPNKIFEAPLPQPEPTKTELQPSPDQQSRLEVTEERPVANVLLQDDSQEKPPGASAGRGDENVEPERNQELINLVDGLDNIEDTDEWVKASQHAAYLLDKETGSDHSDRIHAAIASSDVQALTRAINESNKAADQYVARFKQGLSQVKPVATQKPQVAPAESTEASPEGAKRGQLPGEALLPSREAGVQGQPAPIQTEVETPSPAPQGPVDGVALAKQLNTPAENYDPEEPEQFDQRALSIPLQQLTAAREPLQQKLDQRARMTTAEEDALRTIRDAIAAHRRKNKEGTKWAAAPEVAAPEPAPPRPTPPFAAVQPTLHKSLRGQMTKIANTLRGQLEKGGHHPTTANTLRSLVNQAREAMGENRLKPTEAVGASGLLAEADRLLNRPEPPKRGEELPEDKIKRELEEKDLAGRLPEEVRQAREKAADEAIRKTREKKKAADKAAAREGGGAPPTQPLVTPETTDRGDGGGGPTAADKEASTPAPETKQEKKAAPEKKKEGTTSMEEQLRLRVEDLDPTVYENIFTPEVLSDLDTPEGAFYERMDKADDESPQARASKQAAIAEKAFKVDGVEGALEALDGVEGVFNRMRAAHVLALRLPETEEIREALRRVRGYQQVKQYLEESGDRLFGGMYMSSHPTSSRMVDGVISDEQRQLAQEMIVEAMIPVLHKSFTDMQSPDVSSKRAAQAERDYQAVYKQVLRSFHHELTTEQRKLVAEHIVGEVEAGRLDASVGEDLISGASANLFRSTDHRAYSGRNSEPVPVLAPDMVQLRAQLAERLDAYLKEKKVDDLGGRVVEVIRDLESRAPIYDVYGSYLAKLIVVSLQGIPLNQSVDEIWSQIAFRADHELIHALRDMGLLKDGEYEALRQFSVSFGLDENGNVVAAKDGVKSFRKMIDDDPVYDNGFLDKVAPHEKALIKDEEGVAFAFQYLRRMPPGKPKTIVARIAQFFRALLRALKAVNINSLEQIYANAQDIAGYIEDGKVGSRKRDYQKGFETSGAAVAERLGQAMRMSGPENKRWSLRHFIRSAWRISNITDPKSYEKTTGPEQKGPTFDDPRHVMDQMLTSLNRPAYELLQWAEVIADRNAKIAEYKFNTTMDEQIFVPSSIQTQLKEWELDILDARMNVDRIVGILEDGKKFGEEEGFFDNPELMAMYYAITSTNKPWADVTPEEFFRALSFVLDKGNGEPMYMSARRTIGDIVVNPTRNDLLKMTNVPLHARNEAWKYDTVRFIIDNQNNVYVARAYDMTHDAMAGQLKRAGLLPQGYKFETGPGEGHGGWVVTGALQRKGDQFIGDRPGVSEETIFPKPKPMYMSTAMEKYSLGISTRLLEELERIADKSGALPPGYREMVNVKFGYNNPGYISRLWKRMRDGDFGPEMQERANRIKSPPGGPAAEITPLILQYEEAGLARDQIVERIRALQQEQGKEPTFTRNSLKVMLSAYRKKQRNNPVGQMFMSKSMEGRLPARKYELNPLQMYSQAERAAHAFPDQWLAKDGTAPRIKMVRWMQRHAKAEELSLVNFSQFAKEGGPRASKKDLIDWIKTRKLRLTVAYYYGRGDDPAAAFAGFTNANYYVPSNGPVRTYIERAPYATYTMFGRDAVDHNYMEVAAVIEKPQRGSDYTGSHVGPSGTVYAFLISGAPEGLFKQHNVSNPLVVHQGQSDLHDNGYDDEEARRALKVAVRVVEDRYRTEFIKAHNYVKIPDEEIFRAKLTHPTWWVVRSPEDLAKLEKLLREGARYDRYKGLLTSAPDFFGTSYLEEVYSFLDDPPTVSRKLVGTDALLRQLQAYADRALEYATRHHRVNAPDPAADEISEDPKTGEAWSYAKIKTTIEEFRDKWAPMIAEEAQKIMGPYDPTKDVLPFENDYPEVMFRHILMMAISGGNDAIVWPTAATIRDYPGHSTYRGDFYDKRWPRYAKSLLHRFNPKIEPTFVPKESKLDPDEFDEEAEDLVSLAIAEVNSENPQLPLLRVNMNEPLSNVVEEYIQQRSIPDLLDGTSTFNGIMSHLEDLGWFGGEDDYDPGIFSKAEKYADEIADRIAQKLNRRQRLLEKDGRRSAYLLRITPEMREYFLATGVPMMMSATPKGPHSVSPGGPLPAVKTAAQKLRAIAGIPAPTAKGFGVVRKPGETWLGKSPRELAQFIISNVRVTDPNQWSKRTARGMVSWLYSTGKKMSDNKSPLNPSAIIGQQLRKVAGEIYTLGNLPGQGLYLAARSKLMGDINAGVDVAEMLSRLYHSMKQKDFEQFGSYMLRRDAKPEDIDNEDVRAAAVLAKDLFQKFGAENVRVGRMDERQFNKYQGRYLPRKYFRYIENSMRTTGIRFGKQGYLRERLPGRDRQIFGAADAAGHTVDIEKLRVRLTGLLEKASGEDKTRAGLYLIGRLKTPRKISDPALRSAVSSMRTALDKIQADIDSQDLITKRPDFPPKKGPGATPYGPYRMVDRYGKNYLHKAFFRAANRGTSIGKVLETSSLDAQITDPITLSATGLVEQNRDLAIYHFFTALEAFQEVLREQHPEMPELRWMLPDQMVTYQGKTMTYYALQENLNLARQFYHLNQTAMMRGYADKQIAEMEALLNRKPSLSNLTDEYIQLPDTAQYGDLRGLIMHRAIYNDLKGTLGLEGRPTGFMGRGWASFMSLFKQMMTTLNIKGHPRALFQNVATLYFSGVGGHDLGLIAPSFNVQTWSWMIRALEMMNRSAEDDLQDAKDAYGKAFLHPKHGDLWKLAQTFGVRSGTFTTTELRHAYGLVQELKIQEAIKSGDQSAIVGKLRLFADSIEKFKGGAADLFNFWDTWARFTKFVHEVEKNGALPGDAINEANEWSPDYSLVPGWIRALRTSVVPFATYRYKLTPKFFDQISKLAGHIQRGEVVKAGDVALRFMAPTLLWSTLGSLMAAGLLGMNDRQHRAFRLAMQRYYRENPGTVPVPIFNEDGTYTISDLGIMFPWTSNLQAGLAFAKGDIVYGMSQLGMGAYAFDIAAALSTGVDPYTGFELYPPTATEAQKNAAYAAYMLNYFTPPSLRGLMDPMVGAMLGVDQGLGSGDIARILDRAIGDGVSNSGKPIEDPIFLAARLTTGFNFNTYDPLDQIMRNRRELEHEIDAYDEQIGMERSRHRRRTAGIRSRRLTAQEQDRLISQSRERLQRRIRDLRTKQARARRALGDYMSSVRPIREFEHQREDASE